MCVEIYFLMCVCLLKRYVVPYVQEQKKAAIEKIHAEMTSQLMMKEEELASLRDYKKLEKKNRNALVNPQVRCQSIYCKYKSCKIFLHVYCIMGVKFSHLINRERFCRSVYRIKGTSGYY